MVELILSPKESSHKHTENHKTHTETKMLISVSVLWESNVNFQNMTKNYKKCVPLKFLFYHIVC